MRVTPSHEELIAGRRCHPAHSRGWMFVKWIHGVNDVDDADGFFIPNQHRLHHRPHGPGCVRGWRRRPPGSRLGSLCRTHKVGSTGTSSSRSSSTTRPALRRSRRRCKAPSPKAFGIVSQSPLFFLAAKYPQPAGVPVTGSYDDGPEWGTQPYTNMFASDDGSVDPKYPVNTQIGDFLKAHGGTVLGAYGYGISPSSSRAAIATSTSFEHAGGKVGVLNTTVPFGGVAFTSTALVAKQKTSMPWFLPWTAIRTTRWRRHSSRPE